MLVMYHQYLLLVKFKQFVNSLVSVKKLKITIRKNYLRKQNKWKSLSISININQIQNMPGYLINHFNQKIL